MSINEAKFYFCDLKTKDKSCPNMHRCKRFELIKDVPYEEYELLGFAKLYNICNEENGYKLFLKMEEVNEIEC